MATNSLVARKAASTPANRGNYIPSTRRNGYVQPHKTVIRGYATTATKTTKEDEQSFLSQYGLLVGLMWVLSWIGISYMLGIMVSIGVGVASFLVFFFVSAFAGIIFEMEANDKAEAEKRARNAEREAEKTQRKADYEADRYYKNIERELRVKAAAENAFTAYARAQRAANARY